MKGSDSGSALIEFVVLGLVAQLLILGVGVHLVSRQQQQLAAISTAKLIGRSLAAGGAGIDLEAVAEQTANSVGLPREQVGLVVEPRGSLRTITATVGESSFSYTVRKPR